MLRSASLCLLLGALCPQPSKDRACEVLVSCAVAMRPLCDGDCHTAAACSLCSLRFGLVSVSLSASVPVECDVDAGENEEADDYVICRWAVKECLLFEQGLCHGARDHRGCVLLRVKNACRKWRVLQV